jgi:hypothetical protein
MTYAPPSRAVADDGTPEALHARLEAGMSRLIRLVAVDAGLQQLVEAISEMFGRKASIIDTNFTYLALSKGYAEMYIPLGDDPDGEYAPLHVQERLRTTEVFHPSRYRPEPAWFDTQMPDGGINRNYATLIYMKHVPIGSFSVFTDGDDLSPVELGYLPTIASLLSIEFQKSNFYLLNKNNFYSQILARLLDQGPAVDEDMIVRRLAIYGYRMEAFKQVVLLTTRDERFDAARVQSFAERFQGHVPNSVYFIDNGDIIYLTSAKEPAPITGAETEIWRKDIAGAHLRVGLSSVFEHVGEFTRALAEARSAIDSAAGLAVADPVSWFDHFRLADLVRHVSKDVDLDTYLFPPLRWVMNYDRQHGTQLAFTLYSYLHSPGNPRAVWEALFIHKNTLYYRLNQIREIMRDDLESAETRAQIHLSFVILRAQNRLSWPAAPLPGA